MEPELGLEPSLRFAEESEPPIRLWVERVAIIKVKEFCTSKLCLSHYPET